MSQVPVEFLPTRFSFSRGASSGPSVCSPSALSPSTPGVGGRGGSAAQERPIASQAAPLPKGPYLRAAHGALNASFSWGSGPAGKKEEEEEEEDAVTWPLSPNCPTNQTRECFGSSEPLCIVVISRQASPISRRFCQVMGERFF